IAADCEYHRVEDERPLVGRGSGSNREHRRDIRRNNIRLQRGRKRTDCAFAQSCEMMCKTALTLIVVILALSATAFPQAQPQQQPPPEEPPPVFAVPKEYRYNARGRRDPFVNPIPKPANPSPSAAGR